MPYEPEVFRPARPARASRKATAEEIQDHALEFLRGMTCGVSAQQVVDALVDKGVKITITDATRALKRLAGADKVTGEPGSTWTARRRF